MKRKTIQNREMNNGRVLFLIIISVLRTAPVAAVCGVVCSLGFALCTAWGTKILAQLFDQAEKLAGGSASDGILLSACLYLGIIAVRKLLNVINDISNNTGVEEKCRYSFLRKLHKKAASIPYICFEDAKIADQLQRAKECIENFVITDTFHNILVVGECFFAVVGLLIVMAGYSIWYLPILLVTILPYLISRMRMGKEFYELHWFQASHIRKRDYLYSIFSMPGSQREQRVFGFGSWILEKWKKEHALVAEENLSFRKKDSRRLLYCEGLIVAGYVLGILLSVILVFEGQIAIGVFGAGIFAFQEVQQNTKAFFALLGNAFNEMLEANHYFSFLDLKDEQEGTEGIQALTQQITMRNVRFTYPNAPKPALMVENLEIKAGERVIIVGENGSGKSTLGKILLGLYEPEQGEVLYDGKSVSQCKKEDLAKMTAAVSQSFVSWHIPICDQFRIHYPEKAMEDGEIKAALEKAGLDSLFDAKEYRKWLGREFGGRELSGGQWQRLTIAGAMAKPHQLLFLDEPTSALDPVTEYDILCLFLEMSKGKTAVIISHRVGLCPLADKVIYLKEGGVKAVGSHSELMTSCREYAHFYGEQAKWYLAGETCE